MGERRRARLQAGAQQFLEPGETVRLGVVGVESRLSPPALVLAFILVVLFDVSVYAGFFDGVDRRWLVLVPVVAVVVPLGRHLRRIVLLTSEHVYVMRERVWSLKPLSFFLTWESGAVLYKRRLGEVKVSLNQKPNGTHRNLFVGTRKIYLSIWTEREFKRAQAMVAAAQEVPAT